MGGKAQNEVASPNQMRARGYGNDGPISVTSCLIQQLYVRYLPGMADALQGGHLEAL